MRSDGNAHVAGRLGILGHREDCRPHARVLHEQPQCGEDRHPATKRKQALPADVDAGDTIGRVDHGRYVARLGPKNQQQRLLDQERDRKRDQQNGERRAPERTNKHPLHDDAERANQRDRQQAGDP